jgi:hypothetical protein
MTCNGKYLVNDLYFDTAASALHRCTAASALYRCTTAGTNATSVWAQISGGGGGSNWQSPRELDPTRAVPAGTKVFITPDNPIITTGIVDRGSGTLTMAQTGIWEAAVTVPAKALDGAVMKYHVPQFPYPGAGGYSAGPPVTGGLDAPTMFWIYWGALNC